MFRFREINEKFDETIERRGFRENEKSTSSEEQFLTKLESMHEQFQTKCKPIFCDGELVYSSTTDLDEIRAIRKELDEAILKSGIFI